VRSTPAVMLVGITAGISDVDRKATNCWVAAALETGAAVAAVRSTPAVMLVGITADGSIVDCSATSEQSDFATEVRRLGLVERDKNNAKDC
jgi:hypothetical protein